MTSLIELKEQIDARLNDHLCEMKEGYDDSIVGFNEAWDIVREIFAAALAEPTVQKRWLELRGGPGRDYRCLNPDTIEWLGRNAKILCSHGVGLAILKRGRKFQEYSIRNLEVCFANCRSRSGRGTRWR